MTETATFTCSICSEPSLNICVRCTKDACANHQCARCKACSDCCECEVPLTAPETAHEITPVPVPAPEPTIVENSPQQQADLDALLWAPESSEEPDLNVPVSVFRDEPVEPVEPEPEHPRPDDKIEP